MDKFHGLVRKAVIELHHDRSTWSTRCTVIEGEAAACFILNNLPFQQLGPMLACDIGGATIDLNVGSVSILDGLIAKPNSSAFSVIGTASIDFAFCSDVYNLLDTIASQMAGQWANWLTLNFTKYKINAHGNIHILYNPTRLSDTQKTILHEYVHQGNHTHGLQINCVGSQFILTIPE